jgi:O-methyltransferase
MVDAGLWRGGASILMRAVLAAMGDEERQVWSADLCWNPAPPDGSSGAGEVAYPPVPYRTPPLAAVKANFERYSMLDARVTFVVGPFAEMLATTPICDVAVLRLDTGTFESTWDVLEVLYPRVSSGGFVIVNDYGQEGSATRRAVDAFRDTHHVRATVMDIDGTGVYWRVPARSPAA